jgi:hypothetical protein
VVFAVVAVLLVGAVILSACLKEVPLRLVSGNQARAQASGREDAVAQVGAAAESAGTVRAPATDDTAGGAAGENGPLPDSMTTR